MIDMREENLQGIAGQLASHTLGCRHAIGNKSHDSLGTCAALR